MVTKVHQLRHWLSGDAQDLAGVNHIGRHAVGLLNKACADRQLGVLAHEALTHKGEAIPRLHLNVD
jgi:hypothetical protein